MKRARLDDLDPTEFGQESQRRALSDVLETTDVAINHYRVSPGNGLPSGLHAHMDQEEVFVVLAGRATFETLEGEVSVDAGEAIRFAPGDFQSGRNGGAAELEILAIGAPRESGDVRIPVACPDCDHGNLRLEFGEEAPRFDCPACGAEHLPRDCPGCGHDDLRVTLGSDDSPIVRCQACGATYERPPLDGP